VTSPLLSICIPTYAGAQYLRVTLEAVLPQVSRTPDLAEVLVLDDQSPDDTAGVVRAAMVHGPLRYIRNQANLGLNRNLVHAVGAHARGEYAWGWNQHCLLQPGALDRVLGVLQAHADLDAVYVNFRCATYPRDWPDTAVGGYAGAFESLANAESGSRIVERWQDLLDPRTSMGTQSYAHIVRRRVFADYWASRPLGANLSTALECYPHTCAVAEHMFGRRSFYLGEPALTIYNGAQSWSALATRARVYLRGYPDLMRLYRRLGWPAARLREAEAWGALRAQRVMVELLREPGARHLRWIGAYLWNHWRQRGSTRAVWNAVLESRCCAPVRGAQRLAAWLRAVHRYCCHDCRPARWLRAQRSKP
jgi:hypothetical protein